jgi:hypothetical protein
MIDTVVMILEMGKFTIKDPSRFSPPADLTKDHIKINKPARYKFICNPSKIEQKNYYYPRLTLMQQCFGNGSYIIRLKIEFSAPKLLFKNNFNELSDESFDLVIETLFKKLDEMAIATTKEFLRNAYIQKIDYSKNIILDEFITCSMVISELSKLNLNKRLDLTKTDYRNEGQAIAYHSGAFEIKIYDKIKDLEQGRKFGKKRSMEQENQYQHDLFNYTDYKDKLKNAEVLRFEGRFQRKKLKSLLLKLKINAKLIFKDLFKRDISRAILMHYLNQIISELYVMQFDLKNIDNVIASIKSQNPKIKPARILQLVGFIQTIQSLGNRGARVELDLPNHQWYRMQKDLKQIESNQKNYRFRAVCDLEKKIRDFESISNNVY